MPSNRTHLAAPLAGRLSAILLILLAAVTGCQSTHVPDSTLPQLSGNDPETQLDFWHTLATKSLVSNDEAFHGLLLYIDRSDSAESYAQRVATLKSRNLLDRSFNQPADAALTRGTLAVALVNHLNLKTGITVALFSHSDRYATRELEDAQIYPPSSPNQILSGAAFVGVIGATQDYKHGNPADYPAHVMPSEIDGHRPAVEPPLTVAARGGSQETSAADTSDSEVMPPIFAMMQADNLSLRPATTTTTTSTSPSASRAVITAVEGFVSYRESESAKWKRAVKGMELSEQAELRTGPDGAVQLIIEPDQTIAVDRLTTVKLLRIFREGQRAATDIGIKYGRTRYDLEGGGIEHQSTLRSPNATLAVRGTRVSLLDQAPFTPQAISLTGTAEFRGMRKRPVRFGAAGQGKTRVTSDNTDAAALALHESIIDPTLPGARTASEVPLLANLISSGATVDIDRGSGFRIVRGGDVPRTDAALTPLLPGTLNFVLRWTGNTNLDFAVSTPGTPTTPGGEFIYPVPGLANAPSGGRTAFDHQGGANGGIEVVFFPATTPNGIYSLAGPNVGNQTAIATIDAFLNGQHINLFDGQSVQPTITQTVLPGQPALALASVGSEFPTLPGNPLRLTALKKPIDIHNPPPAVMVGPKAPKLKSKSRR